MKKIIIVLLCVLLTACSGSGDELAAYRGIPAKTLLKTAEHNIAGGNYTEASKRLEALEAIFPFSREAEQGQLDIIYAYYKDGDQASTLAATDRYIRLYPRSHHVDYAYYMKGLAQFNAGGTWLQRYSGMDPARLNMTHKRQAFRTFGQLVHAFPRSRYAADARLHMIYIRNLLAQHQLYIAQFYYKRRAYLAAANRASSVVQHFEGAPAVMPALVVMVKSYRQLKLPKLAKNSLATLQTSYPHSAELEKLTQTDTHKT